MENSELYNEASSVQKRDSGEIFSEFVALYSEYIANCVSVLDVGCGPGDTLVEFVLPKLDNRQRHVVGIDTSKNMIEYARANHSQENLKFITCDIQKKIEMDDPDLKPESFDFVTFFYCYHWIREEKSALANIYQLMKPQASVFMIFPIRHGFFDLTLEQVKVDKFKPYLSNWDAYMTRYYYEKQPKESLKSQLEEAGFKIKHLERRTMKYVFESLRHLENAYNAIMPFKMPPDVASAFVSNSALKLVKNWVDEITEDGGLCTSYDLLIVLATK